MVEEDVDSEGSPMPSRKKSIPRYLLFPERYLRYAFDPPAIMGDSTLCGEYNIDGHSVSPTKDRTLQESHDKPEIPQIYMDIESKKKKSKKFNNNRNGNAHRKDHPVSKITTEALAFDEESLDSNSQSGFSAVKGKRRYRTSNRQKEKPG